MPKFRLATFFCAFALVGTGLPARADAPDPEVAALRTQITSLTARLDTLEKRAETRAIVAPAPAANVVTNGDFPGSFNLGGSTTSVALHGFISLQSMYDVDQNVGDKFGPGNILPPGNERNQTAHTWHFHDRLSRLSVETRTRRVPDSYAPILQPIFTASSTAVPAASKRFKTTRTAYACIRPTVSSAVFSPA